jgi:hypothetical protein
MKTILARAALLALPFGALATLPACNPQTQQWITNATVTAQEVETTANTVLADAQVAWPVVYALIPAAQQAGAQQSFTTALKASNRAVLLLADAIAAAQAANQSNPDFTTAIQAVSDAIAQVIAIVNQFTQKPAPAVAAASGEASGTMDQLTNDLAIFKRVAHTK